MIQSTALNYGACTLSPRGKPGSAAGRERYVAPASSHRLLSDGMVQIGLPANGLITDAEARRLAWAILSDLAPDDVIPTPDVVTYKEAQRLAVLRCVADGKNTYPELCEALSWGRRCVERRVRELVEDGRLDRHRDGNGMTTIRIGEDWR